MSYKHILVAVDLSPDSKILIDKAVSLASAVKAELSFIHIDANYEELNRAGGGFVDINFVESQSEVIEHSKLQMQELAAAAGYPVKFNLVGSGEFDQELKAAIIRNEVDLLICGHHQDFWSVLLSSTKQIINSMPVDMLVVPLVDE